MAKASIGWFGMAPRGGTDPACGLRGRARQVRALAGRLTGLAGLLWGLGAGCVEVPLGQPGDALPADGGVPASWQWESPLPQGNNLRSLWGVAGATADQDQLYAGGDNGTLIMGGTAGWQLTPQGDAAWLTQQAILALAGPRSGTSPQVLAVGVSDLALLQTSGRWADVSPRVGDGTGALNAAWATPTAGEYYVVGTTGRMFHVQGGANWTAEGAGVTTDTLFGITGSGSGATLELYAVGDNGRIAHRTSGTWKVEADNLLSSPLNAVWIGDGAASGEVFAVGNSGTALHKQAGTWTVETTGTTSHLTAAWGSGSDLYAVGASGTILHRKGGTWQREAVGLTSELLSSVWGTVRSGQLTLYAAGNLGTLLRLDGGTWKSLSSRVTSSSLNGVWARSPSELYAVGGGGVIARRSGPAAQGSWTAVAAGVTTESLNAVTGWSASPTDGEAEVWAVGSTGTIVHKSGTTWNLEASYLTNQELTGVWAGLDSVYVVGRGGRIYHKSQGSWNIETGPMGMPVTNDLSAVWGTGSGAREVVYVVGDHGLVLRHDMLGWTAEGAGLTSDTLTALFGASEDTLFALISSGGALHRLAGKWQRDGLLGASFVGFAGCVIPGTTDLLIAASQGLIARRTAAGWITDSVPTVLPYSGVAAAAPSDYYIVGSGGMILHKY